MENKQVLDVAAEVGYRLATNGAEIYRVEESVSRILAAYHISADVYAIPNSLIICINSTDGEPITKMRRIAFHGNDIDYIERYSDLSRKICEETPEPDVALSWIFQVEHTHKTYSALFTLLGYFLAGAGFSVFFGGDLFDFLAGGFCGFLVGIVSRLLNHLRVNSFFVTTASAFLLALAAYGISNLYAGCNADCTITGALMLLVPGLLFTNAMRDVILGDVNSGAIRMVQVLLTAAAIALGTGAAWNLLQAVWTVPNSIAVAESGILTQVIASFVACTGFVLVFNIHGSGAILCSLGAALTTLVYNITYSQFGNDLLGFFLGAVFAAAYSEIMARLRKKPAVAYLFISILPLIPGVGIYFTTNYLVRGDMSAFADSGIHTVEIAGTMAVGILIVTTLVRLIYGLKNHK